MKFYRGKKFQLLAADKVTLFDAKIIHRYNNDTYLVAVTIDDKKHEVRYSGETLQLAAK